MPRMRFHFLISLSWVWAFLGALPAGACSVPVFRYALERWEADSFEATVFFRGALTPEQGALVSRVEESDANVRVRLVDLGSEKDETVLETWEEQGTEVLPWVYLSYPESHPIALELAKGPLEAAFVDSVLDSPMRQTISRQLAEGETAFWVLLESGNPLKDEAAWQLLQGALVDFEKTLELPSIDQADIDAGLLALPEEHLKIAFSALRLSRDNPDEVMFRRMLLDTEEDLIDRANEPIIFPVFGRGRILYGIVGDGITAATLREAAIYLVGACSCQVKDENPGVDALMSLNWNTAVTTSYQVDRPLPELTGIVPEEKSEPTPELPVEVPAASVTPALVEPVDTTGSLILWTTIPLLLAMAGAVVFGGAYFLKRPS